MKICVLGSTGFVGRAIIRSDAMQALRNSADTIYHAARTHGQDLMEFDAFVYYLKRISPDVIINCAANVGSVHYVTEKAADVIHNNTQMAINLYAAVKESCPSATVVNVLANCAYPAVSDIQKEDELFNGQTHLSVLSYGSFKRYLYVISKCYNMQYGIKSINFIAPNAYGSQDSSDPNKTHALNGMIIRMLAAQNSGDGEFEVWGSGTPVREWIYVDDMATILLESIFANEDLLSPINMGQNKGYSIKETAELIADAVGYEGKIVYNTNYQDGDSCKILDDTRFRVFFPNYEFYDFKKGIENTVEYYKEIL